ncbi:MAG TPA: ATP-binding protein [Blastocatellia bacterium]|nr:ATP-binding protein [Blastocatellia bacterium]
MITPEEKLNILLVDDLPAKLLSYEAILSDLGENLIKANSASEALEQLLKNEIAVVLMDVSMPELDGFELAEIIRQHPRYQKTAIIFVSGVHLTDLDRVKAYERGAVDYVSVPIVPEILRAKVSIFVELYRKTRQLEQINLELERRVAERTEELQRRNEELQRLNAELERSNIELDSFAYIASHDLKEPLRGLHNYSHFLLEDYEDKLDEEGVSKLQTLIKLTQRMETLIDSLLYYSRVGRAELAVRDINLDEVLDQTLELLAPRVRELGVEVRRPCALPTVRADHARVGEVFSNLIANALKYNDKETKWIEVGFEWTNGAGEQQPVFYLRDNGLGIAPEHHENVFRIFKRLHGRDEYGGGVGAGLTIVRKIIERHGGRIWLESEPGMGTTFYFTLGEATEEAAA